MHASVEEAAGRMNESAAQQSIEEGRNRSATYLVHLGLDDVAVGAVEPARGNVLHRRRPAHQLGLLLLPEERVRERGRSSPERTAGRPEHRRRSHA